VKTSRYQVHFGLIRNILLTSAAAFAVATSHASGRVPATFWDIASTDVAFDGEWFATFAGFQSYYGNIPAPVKQTLSEPEESAQVQDSTQQAAPTTLDPAVAPRQFTSFTASASAFQTVTPITYSAQVISIEPVLRTISIPAETAPDTSSTMVPRTIIVIPPTPQNKPVYSNL